MNDSPFISTTNSYTDFEEMIHLQQKGLTRMDSSTDEQTDDQSSEVEDELCIGRFIKFNSEELKTSVLDHEMDLKKWVGVYCCMIFSPY